MPIKTRYRKRKRTSKESFENNAVDSDNEVTFKVKRPRKDSLGVDDSSNSSADSGFKSNSSSSTKSSSDTLSENSSRKNSSIKDAAIYYAKKSPAKQQPPQPTSFLSEKVAKQLGSWVDTIGNLPSNDTLTSPCLDQGHKNIKHDETNHTQRKVISSESTIVGRKRNKNVKGLTLDVEASAKLRKVENIIELNGANEKVLPRRSPNGYLLPEPVPVGSILNDLMQNRWKIGKSIGVGGFGEIYSAELLNEGQFVSAKSPKNNYVIKVEPHSNGPLFVETNFYLRATRPESIQQWKNQHNQLHLGVPHVEGSGSFRLRGKKFRFLVIPRYGTDLQTLLDQSGSTLSIATACSIASQVIDSYEYIHSKGYVHKDCKGSNILFINRGSTAPEVTRHTPMKKICLVDYGLVSKYVTREGSLHKPYRVDERSAHEGTLEYTSRDAHLGCVSRRGDIEVLLYCLIEWLGGKLPWDLPQQPHPKEIHKNKISAFQTPDQFLEKAFSESLEDIKSPPPFLNRLMNYIEALEFEEKPDYNYLRSIFQAKDQLMKSDLNCGQYSSEDEEVNLALSIRSKTHLPPPISPLAKTTDDDDTDDEIVFNPRLGEEKKVSIRIPRTRHMDEANTKQRMKEEMLAKKDQNAKEEEKWLSEERFMKEREMLYKKMCMKSLQNPTPVMLQQIGKIEERKHQNFQRSLSEIKDSPSFRRSKFVMVGGAKRARSRSLVVYDDENLRTPKRDKEPPMPRSLQYRKTIQRRKGNCAAKRLFKNSSALLDTSIINSTKTLQRRSNKSVKSVINLSLVAASSDVKSSPRRRHRSGPVKETAALSPFQELSPAPKSSSPYRRNKKNNTHLVIPMIQEDKQGSSTGFSKHVQDFSSIFNKALSNVTKSILRYNSKS